MTAQILVAGVALLVVVWFGVWAVNDLLKPLPQHQRAGRVR